MKRSGFVVSLNKLGKDMLFGAGQSSLRFLTSANSIAVKPGRSDRSVDAVPMTMPKIGGPSARIDGVMAPELAKLFYKLGYSSEKPYFILEKGEAGWWFLEHSKESEAPSASTLFIKASVPAIEDIKTVTIEPSKRGRKPGKKSETVAEIVRKPRGRPAKATMKKLDVGFNPAPIPALLSEYSRSVYESISHLVHSAKRGRKSADTLAAENSLADFKVVAASALGLDVFTSKLRQSMETMKLALSQVEESLAYLETDSSLMELVQAKADPENIEELPVIQGNELPIEVADEEIMLAPA